MTRRRSSSRKQKVKPGKKSMNQYLHQKLKAKITENLETVDRSSCGSWKARVLQVFKNLPSSIFLASHYKLSYLHSECVFCLLAHIVRASSDSKLRHWSGKKNRTLSCFSCVVSHWFTFDPLIFVYPSYHMHPFQRFKNDYNSKNVTRRKILPPNSECFRNPIRFAELIWKWISKRRYHCFSLCSFLFQNGGEKTAQRSERV